jgi:hypothetical protein
MSAQDFKGLSVAVATLHGKGAIIASAFEEWNWQVVEVPVNTNAFGTFPGEVERTLPPIETALAKIEAAYPYSQLADMILASEGSFFPHPEAPMLTLNTEWVVLKDFRSNRVFQAQHTDYYGPAGRIETRNWEVLHDFAKRMDFPHHGLIIMSNQDHVQERVILKDCLNDDMLKAGFDQIVRQHGAVIAEPDFRAMRAPNRQKHIALAAAALLDKLASDCPQCQQPGFGRQVRLEGLPCSWCGRATRLTRAWQYHCDLCGHEEEMPITITHADPGNCDWCNP